MISSQTTLIFDPNAAPCARGRVSTAELTQRILERGVRAFDIVWNGLAPIALPVEDDVAFLCDAYSELHHLVHEGATHSVYLADGALEVTSKRHGAGVRMSVRHTPFLRREEMTRHEWVIPFEKYLAGWEALMAQLTQVVEEPGTSANSAPNTPPPA